MTVDVRTTSRSTAGGLSRHLEAALEVVDGPAARTGLLVVGPRGMGKSTLLDDLEATLDGVVLRVRGLRNVPTVPFGAATLAKTAVISALGLPEHTHPDEIVPVGQPRSTDGTTTGMLDPRALGAFVQAMRGATGHQRVFLLVDDVDHVDTASRMFFALAAAHTSTLPGALVCTTTQEQDVPELHELRRLELQPLTVADVVTLTEGTRSLTPTQPVAQRIRELTDGRPAVVQELVEQLTDSQLLGTSLIPTTARLGDTARAAVADLMAEIPPQTLEALHLVVTSGTRLAGLVSRMLDSTGSSLEDLVDDGALSSSAGIVRPVSGLVERHLRATTTSMIRRRAARALLDSCADDLDAVQEHFSRSVASSDVPGASAGLVVDLADHALTLVRSSSSSDAGDRARRLLAAAWPHSTPEVRGALSAAEAQVALHDGLLGDATAVAQAALDDFAGGPGRVALARVVQNVRLLTEETVSASLALDTLDQALETRGPTASASASGELQAAEAFAVETALMLLAVGRPTAAQTVAERLLGLHSQLSESLQAELDYVLARTGSDATDEHPDEALRRWSRARDRAEADRPDVSGRTPWEAAGLHLYALRHAGKIPEARRVLASLSTTPCSRYERMLFDLNHATVEYARGNYALASHHVEKMSELADLGSCATSLRVTVGLGSALHGEPLPGAGEMLRTTREYRGTTLGPTLLDVRAEITRGVVFLVSGQTDHALDLLEHARSSLFLDDDERAALADTMVTVVLPVALARAYVVEGRPADAAALSARGLPGDDRYSWMSAAARELVDAVVGTPWDIEVPVTPDVVRWLTDPRLVQPVRDHLRYLLSAQPSTSRALRAPGRDERGEARSERVGARTDRVGSPHDRSPVPADVRSALSDRELQIALLVSQGMRNKEISATVFLSVRTVEATLTRVFRKVDVRSRTELVSRLGGSTAVLSGDVAR